MTDTAVTHINDPVGLSDPLRTLSLDRTIRWGRSDSERAGRVEIGRGERGQSDIVISDSQGTTAIEVKHRIDARQLPVLRRHIANHPALTNNRLALVRRLWPIVLSKALQSGLQVQGAIDVEENNEDDLSQVVLFVQVRGNAPQTFALWRSLDDDIDRWTQRLKETDRIAFVRNIGMRFAWSS